MPKPTFLQTVLRKPARSYADVNAPSPWADDYDRDERPYQSSRYNPRDEYYSPATGGHLRQRSLDTFQDAGPSRRVPARGPSSTLSASAASDRMATRTPKTMRQGTRPVRPRNGKTAHALPPTDAISEVGSAQGSSDGMGRSATTKRRKDSLAPLPPAKVPSSAGEMSSRSAVGRVSGSKTKKTGGKQGTVFPPIDDGTSSMLSSPRSTTSFSVPPPIRLSKERETSSSAPSSPLPASPVAVTHPIARKVPEEEKKAIRPAISVLVNPSAPVPLLTPPSSAYSSSNSVGRRQFSLPPINAQPAKPVLEAVTDDESTDDDHEVFYTPRSSFYDLSTPTAEQESLEYDPIVTPKLLQSETSAPTLNLLPPTPAPIPDPPSSPFCSEAPSTTSLHPHHGFPIPSRHRSSPSHVSREPDVRPRVPPKNVDEYDIQSDSGQVGSDDDEESERRFGTRIRNHSPQSVSRAPSTVRPSSRAPSFRSNDGGHNLKSRSPRHVSRTSFEGGSRAASEGSFGSGAGMKREGSQRGSAAGFGKGGWAAAAASNISRTSSPVMFLPSQGTGWEGFHQPPARQSKFTPLPTASAPSFDKLVNPGTSPSNPSSNASPSQNGNVPQMPSLNSESSSSPSVYSQRSLPDSLPLPSRSYTKDHFSQTSYSSRLSEVDERVPRLGGVNSTSSRGEGVSFPANNSSPIAPFPTRLSPPHSETPTSLSRPQSPVPVNRPTTPRAGFQPPSFLDPDMLTILPEMTAQDSERLYHPAAHENGKSRSRMSLHDSSIRGLARSQSQHLSRRSSVVGSRSEVNSPSMWDVKSAEEYDHVAELPLPLSIKRSKSLTGSRRGGASTKWDGSSYGDGSGVLMESNGRSDGTRGYTNLVLPSGAYKPSKPNRSAPQLDARILGLPHATMASITLQTTLTNHRDTPAHLRDQLPPLVDFSSHLKPPSKTGKNQILVQIYAVAIDQVDVSVLEGKGRGDVGKWVPGRSFVGRALGVGTDEKEIVRGDIVVGINDIRKSGALSEYVLVDRRHIARAPFPTDLTLEQLSILPLQGIAAARCVRGSLTRYSRAIIHNPYTGIAALVCQEMARAGVNITAIIAGGESSHEAHKRCIENGAKGVLMGSPAAVMINMEEGGYDFVFDVHGGERVYETARKVLKDGGKLVSTRPAESFFTHVPPQLASRPSGMKTLRAVFGSKRKDSKYIQFEYLPPTGSGEPEVDIAGMDCRDVLEEPCMAIFSPVLDVGQGVLPFEKGAGAFRRANWDGNGVKVIRIIN